MGSSGLPALSRLALTAEHMQQMSAYAAACLPAEACGLLAGTGDTVHEVMPVANLARSAVRFRMEPAAQLRAFQRIEAAGLQLVGIFHSHPAGPDHPSDTDVREAAYPVVHIIWFPHEGRWNARGYWIEQMGFSEVKLDVAGGA